MTMIEKMARSIAERRGVISWLEFTEDARASLTALNEPTAEMIAAPYELPGMWEDHSPSVVWKAMLSAAAQEGKE